MLEWQFQKRLQESKQSDEDEEEEDDEDMDTMIIMQRLEAEKRARVRRVVVLEGGRGISVGEAKGIIRKTGGNPSEHREGGWRQTLQQRSLYECPALCICNMLLSSLCHAELL